MKFIINEEGFYIGFGGPNTLLENNQSEVPFPPEESFIKPKWFQERWIEGATDEEISEDIMLNIPETPLWRIRAILKLMGKETVIEDALNSLPEPTRTGAQYIWNYGTLIESTSQTVLFIQAILNMSTSEVNEIFIQANNIQI